MIIKELLENDRVRHYSNQNMMIKQVETGDLYEDAVDPIPCRFTYEETDIPIPIPEITEEEKLNIEADQKVEE
jgi:hypothetical protein